MADPIEDATRQVVDHSTTEVRCLLLVVAAALETASDQATEPRAEATEPPADGTGLGVPSTANRCAASEPPASVSLGQQRLVCFDRGHVDCPRFVRATGSPRGASGRSGRPVAAAPIAVATVRVATPEPASPAVPSDVAAAGTSAGASAGTPAAADPPAGPVVPVAPVVRSTRRSGARRAGSRPRPVIVASAILVVALVIAFVFTSSRGGLAMPSPSPDAAAVVGPSVPSAAVGSSTVVPSATPSIEPSTGPSPTPSPSPASSSSPSPTPSPSPTVGPTPTPAASVPAAYAGLKPCPDAPDCYLYRIHAGDNLTAIAKRFGVTLVALKAANPEVKDPSLLHVGDKIRVPLPAS